MDYTKTEILCEITVTFSNMQIVWSDYYNIILIMKYFCWM